MDNPEHDELVTIRTQLTVALLAVTQLQRKHAGSTDADRLLTYVATALASITREVRKIDALIACLEDRDAMRANPVRLRLRRHSSGDHERQGNGEPDSHRAETPGSSSTV